jgi:uncharacterized membrane protein YhfC
MIFTYPLSNLLQIAFPIAIAIWFIRRYRVSWRVVGTGAAAFLLSQALHIPFLNAVQPTLIGSLPANLRVLALSLFLGLAAGVFEETARAVCYWWLKDRARSWQGGVALGIGHGGAESAIFIGLSALVSFIYLMVLRSNPQALQASAEAQIQVKAFFATDWYLPLVGLFERVMAFTLQIALSLIVLQAFLRHNALWYVAAVLWHTLIDGTAVFMSQSGAGLVAIEGALVVFAVISLWMIWAFKPREVTPSGIDPSAGMV